MKDTDRAYDSVVTDHCETDDVLERKVSAGILELTRRQSSTIREFTSRSQELQSVSRRIFNGSIVSEEDLKRFDLSQLQFHTLEPMDVSTRVCSNLVNGLSNANATDRLKKYGPNLVSKVKDRPLWVKFFLSFLSGFSPLLWVATFFVFLSWKPFGSPPSDVYNLALAVVLLVVIFVSGLFNFFQEVLASSAMSNFDNLIPIKCIVIREGVTREIPVTELVVGDISVLKVGMKIPADLRIVEEASLRIDTSMLTGEQLPMKATISVADKSVCMLQSTNIGFMGCNVVDGEGKGIVIANGANTQLSLIASQVTTAVETTGLQKDLNRFVVMIAGMAIVTMMTVALVWTFILRVDHPTFMTLSSFIANAISVVVAFVPEGLPLALSMGLTIIARRLCGEHKVLAKQLSIIETVGSMSLLASDKTGTLTQNKMTMTYLITGYKEVEIVDVTKEVHPMLLQWVCKTAWFCNQVKVQGILAGSDEASSAPSTPRSSFTGVASVDVLQDEPSLVGGNGIDVALMKWMLRQPSLSELRSNFVVKAVVPFSSSTKIAAVVISSSASSQLSQYSSHVLLKGAPEYVLDRCSSVLDDEGIEVPLTAQRLEHITTSIENLASRGCRVIGIAKHSLLVADYPPSFVFKTDTNLNFPLNNLTFVACAVVSDPPRAGVTEAITALHRAGIKIAMVTGDAANTATAIARQVGVVSGDVTSFVPTCTRVNMDIEGINRAATPSDDTALVIVGSDMDNMSEWDWTTVCSHSELVFARVTPDQKLMIVREFQARGEIVGVTGDGVNDSPALHKANVGIAMNAGSDVAKDSADVVLLDNNFEAIVKSVEEGRLIFSNLQKVIGYQIAAGCWSELIPVLATFFVGMPQPLSSFLMIIISCMTDVYAGVALTRETSEFAIMTLPPRNPVKQPLVSWSLIAYAYLFYGTMASVASFVVYFVYMYQRGPRDVPNPIPSDDTGELAFPAGYTPNQLLFAWNWGSNANNLGADNLQAAISASSVFFVVLAVTQWGHLVSIRRSTPYFSDSIMDTHKKGGSVWGRLYEELLASTPKPEIVLAIVASMLTVVFFTEVPIVQTSCGTDHVHIKFWGLAIGFSVVLFFVGEARKWTVLLTGKF